MFITAVCVIFLIKFLWELLQIQNISWGSLVSAPWTLEDRT